MNMFQGLILYLKLTSEEFLKSGFFFCNLIADIKFNEDYTY